MTFIRYIFYSAMICALVFLTTEQLSIELVLNSILYVMGIYFYMKQNNPIHRKFFVYFMLFAGSVLIIFVKGIGDDLYEYLFSFGIFTLIMTLSWRRE